MTSSSGEQACEEALSELWAGTMEDIKLNLPLHRAVMTVRVVNSPEARSPDPKRRRITIVSWYEVVFDRVTRFAFADVDTNPWTVTELTEIFMARLEGKTKYSFTLSDNDDALTIVCEDVRVTFLQKDVTPRSAAT